MRRIALFAAALGLSLVLCSCHSKTGKKTSSATEATTVSRVDAASTEASAQSASTTPASAEATGSAAAAASAGTAVTSPDSSAGSSGSTSRTDSASAGSTARQSWESEPAPDYGGEDGQGDASVQAPSTLTDALSYGVGWGADAGSSLKSAIAAVQMIRCANTLAPSWSDATDAQEQAAESLSAMAQDERENFVDNWEGIAANADALFSDPDSMEGLLTDAGVSEQAAEATAVSGAADNWKTLRTAMDSAVRAAS